MFGNSFQPQFFDYTDPNMDPLGARTGGMPMNNPNPMPGDPAKAASSWAAGLENTLNAAGNYASAPRGPQKWTSGLNLANTVSQAVGGPSLLGGSSLGGSLGGALGSAAPAASAASGAAAGAGAAGAASGAAGAAGGSGCGSGLMSLIGLAAA